MCDVALYFWNQDLDELRKEVQEARRIKMLHQPSRVITSASDILFNLGALYFSRMYKLIMLE